MKWLIITCDATKKIVPAQNWLFEKYIKHSFDIIYVDLKSENVKTWSSNILNKVDHLDDEFIGFSLDDYLPIYKFDSENFEYMMTLMNNDSNIVRYELGQSFHPTSSNSFIVSSKKKSVKDDAFIVRELSQEAGYRLSCQPSIWRVKYLFDKLNHCCSPWEFETAVSDKTKHDNKKIIMSDNRAAFKWIRHSALSAKWDKINVLGLKLSDIKSLVSLHKLKEEDLQLGPWPSAPNFCDFGYDFKFEDLKSYNLKSICGGYSGLHQQYGFNYK